MSFAAPGGPTKESIHDSKPPGQKFETADRYKPEAAGVNVFETLREQVPIGRLVEPGGVVEQLDG